MLVFDLIVVTKALAQFEHSSEVLIFDCDASPKAIVQFEQATEVDEAFLGHSLHLRLGCVYCCLRPCWSSCAPIEHG